MLNRRTLPFCCSPEFSASGTDASTLSLSLTPPASHAHLTWTSRSASISSTELRRAELLPNLIKMSASEKQSQRNSFNIPFIHQTLLTHLLVTVTPVHSIVQLKAQRRQTIVPSSRTPNLHRTFKGHECAKMSSKAKDDDSASTTSVVVDDEESQRTAVADDDSNNDSDNDNISVSLDAQDDAELNTMSERKDALAKLEAQAAVRDELIKTLSTNMSAYTAAVSTMKTQLNMLTYTLNEVLKVPSRAQTTASKVSIPRKFASSALRLVQPRAGCAHTHLDLARDSDTIQLSVVFPRFRKRRPFRTFSNTQQATKPRLNQPQTALHNNERQQQHNNTVDPCMDSYLHMTIRVNSAYPAALNAKVSVVDTQHALDFCHSSFCLLRAGACLLHQREPSHLSPTHSHSLTHSLR